LSLGPLGGRVEELAGEAGGRRRLGPITKMLDRRAVELVLIPVLVRKAPNLDGGKEAAREGAA